MFKSHLRVPFPFHFPSTLLFIPALMSSSPFSRSARRPPGDPALRARDERLEALKSVVGKLAHDFNNFLVPQFGYVTLLQDELPVGSTGSQYVSTMEAAGRNAEVELDTVEGQGTTITVWVPFGAIAPNERRTPVDRSLEPRLVPKKMVLLMEEDPIANEVLRDWLSRCGFDVQAARSFDDAIQLFDRRAAEWALVVTETDLHEHRGEELFERLHPLNRSVSWIFLAGRRVPALSLDVNGPIVLQKPFTMRTFAEILQKHVAK